MSSSLARILEPEAMDTAEEAEGYDRMDHTGPNRAFATRLLELGARGSVLDIGTGPAHLPIMLCELEPQLTITAIDLAHHMLRVAGRNLEASEHGSRIELLHGDAKGLGFADGQFDAVYSNTILHHIPDPRPFLREVARLVKPGGALLVRDLFRPADSATLEHLVATYAADCDDYQRGLFAASLHAAFTPEELRELCDECGLGHAEVVVDTDRHVSIQVRAKA
jgi:ubiquinone/menaquinone biosynthesis C-methylase UbiE